MQPFHDVEDFTFASGEKIPMFFGIDDNLFIEQFDYAYAVAICV
jgi:hypothetical protein